MSVAAQMPITGRVAGFVSHLRLNGFALGPAESELAVSVLKALNAPGYQRDRQGLKTALCADMEQWRQFDDLFEAYWFGQGRTREVLEQQGPRGLPVQISEVGLVAQRVSIVDLSLVIDLNASHRLVGKVEARLVRRLARPNVQG